MFNQTFIMFSLSSSFKVFVLVVVWSMISTMKKRNTAIPDIVAILPLSVMSKFYPSAVWECMGGVFGGLNSDEKMNKIMSYVCLQMLFPCTGVYFWKIAPFSSQHNRALFRWICTTTNNDDDNNNCHHHQQQLHYYHLLHRTPYIDEYITMYSSVFIFIYSI